MALILNIDSSMQESSVSIARGGSMLQHLTNSSQKDHAAFLHVAVKELLEDSALSPADLDAVAVTAGPGSYTGLRVGFAAAKGLSYALHKPLISISTTEVLAESVRILYPYGDYYCPMIDARRNEVFTATYNRELKEVKSPHAMIVNESSFNFFPEPAQVYFFGNGAWKWEKISNASSNFFPETGNVYTAIAALSHKYFSEKKFADINYSVPLYGKEFYTG